MATTLSSWTIDPVHSSVEFSLDYMGFSTYRTGFRALEGSLQFDAARPAASSAITFTSTRVEAVDLTHWMVTGDLTIHGAAMDTGAAYLGERVQISLAILATRQD